jgi:hypothetical protein
VRVQGWQRLLNQYVIDAQERYKCDGFSYAGMHCVTFCADWVQALTGSDPLAAYRGQYTTAEGAATKLAELDGGSLLQALKNRFGEPSHPTHAQRGDVAYARLEDGECCGIYFTTGARMHALFLGERGFTLRRARDTDFAFRVE